MNDILKPFLDSFFIIYVDDIKVYNQSWEEYLEHLKQVLQTL